jgi:D-3-phosphoglycerate dehydrogenase / 2-oxoglutarate reductase
MPIAVVTGLNGDQGPHWELLKQAGFEARLAPRDVDLFQAENLISVVKDASAVIAGSEPYSADTLARLPKLRVIARMGVGFDAIDVPAADKQRIVVATTPGVNHHAVAEHTIALDGGGPRISGP